MSGKLKRAMLGALVADAVCMPVHWYYDTGALDRDYPDLNSYQAPKNPHPESILWRSKYTPRNKEADILHEQAKYWGQRGIHYHQFLAPGDNTLNYRLGLELYRSIITSGAYDPDAWLNLYIDCMRRPGWHKDTYPIFNNWPLNSSIFWLFWTKITSIFVCNQRLAHLRFHL